MPVKIERSNPNWRPGRYYPHFLSEGLFSQAFLRREYARGNPHLVVIGEKKGSQTAEDKIREAENLKFHPRPGSEPLIKIRMLETRGSSPNGIQVVTYKAGEIYELGQAQGSRFVRAAWAELMEGKLSDIEDHADVESEKKKLKEFMNAAPKKLKVKMIETHDSSPDGIHALRFREKETYELPETLARDFIRAGWAVILDDGKKEKEEK